MFNTLESNWDPSARRGWITIASFTLQAASLGLFMAISLLWMERPPQVHWLVNAPSFIPSESAEPARASHRDYKGPLTGRSILNPITPAPSTTRAFFPANDADTVGAPDFRSIQTKRGEQGTGIPSGLGIGLPPAIPIRMAVTKPVVVSNLGEGSLIYRVQPTYPALARQARVQGSVQLRALISKTGKIENLMVVRGHPMLSAAAIEAVRQWRYRPYLLNHEPVEVETEITVNFLLSGGE